MSRNTLYVTLGSVLGLGFIVIGFLAYQTRSSRGLEIDIAPPDKISIGVPFDLRVGVSNTSSDVLENLRLSVSLPSGLAFVGSPASKNIDFRDMDNLGSGGLSQQTFKLIALDGENTIKQITASAAYVSGSISSRFQKSASKDIAIGSYGLSLNIAAPQSIFNGQAFDSDISCKNDSEMDLDNLTLKIDYPLTFSLTKSTLPPDLGNNTWVLGGLRHGSDMKFKISGTMIGPEGASFDMKATIEAVINGQTYPISSNQASIVIATSPIFLKIALNKGDEAVVKPGDSLNYVLSYVNNTDALLRNVTIKAQLAGAIFDFVTLDTAGTFRSSDNTLSWNSSNDSALSSLSPGKSGSVNFTIRAKSDYPIKRLGDKNFTVKVTATIESPTVPQNGHAGGVSGFASIENKVQGRISLSTKAYFRDASSGILNKGPMPPRLNQSTQYTVHWLLTNYSTDAKDVEVRAFLGDNVKFTGTVKGNSPTIPAYNDSTREVVWRVPLVGATAGIVGRPVETIFQIEATPSLVDVGRNMLLMQDSSLKAIDVFTDAVLSDKNNAITSSLLDDPTVVGQGMVAQ